MATLTPVVYLTSTAWLYQHILKDGDTCLCGWDGGSRHRGWNTDGSSPTVFRFSAPIPKAICAACEHAAWQELVLLREAIALAECNCCEDSLGDNDWVVVDYTEHYDPRTENDLRPFWMCMQGIWSTERKALLCASCAASDTSATSPFRSAYRNHRGPGLRLLGPDLRLLEREEE